MKMSSDSQEAAPKESELVQDSMSNSGSTETILRESSDEQNLNPLVVTTPEEREATRVAEASQPATIHSWQTESSAGSREMKTIEEDASSAAAVKPTMKEAPTVTNSAKEGDVIPAKRQRKPSRKEQESMSIKRKAAMKQEEENVKPRKGSRKSPEQGVDNNKKETNNKKAVEQVENKPKAEVTKSDEKIEAPASESVNIIKPVMITSGVSAEPPKAGDDVASAQTTSDGEDNEVDEGGDEELPLPPAAPSLLPTSSSSSASSSSAAVDSEPAKSKEVEAEHLSKELSNRKLTTASTGSSASGAASRGSTMSIAQVMTVVYTDADFVDLSKDTPDQLKSKLHHAMDELNHHKQISDVLKLALEESDNEYSRLGKQLKSAREERVETQRVFEKGLSNKRRKLSDLREEEAELINEIAKLNKSREELEQNSHSTIHQLTNKLEGTKVDILQETKTAEDALHVIKDLQETQAKGKRDALEQEKSMLLRAIEIKRAQVHLSMVQDLKLKDERSREFLMQVIRKRALTVDVNANGGKSQ